MTEPNNPERVTPGEQRRSGLRRARWVAVGASVGAAAFLTGAIAAVNTAPSGNSDSDSNSSTQVQTNNRIADDEYTPAVPFSPQSQTQVPTQNGTQNGTQVTPQFQQPQTRSRGS